MESSPPPQDRGPFGGSVPPVSAQAVPPQPPQRIVLEQPGGWFGRLGKLLLAALLISVIFNFSQHARYKDYFSDGSSQIEEKYHSLSRTSRDKVALLHIDGAILSDDGFIKKQIDRIRKDDNIKAVVLRIDSPGGSVSASDYLFHHLKTLREDRELPMVVSMGGLCASGGYYLAMAVGDEKDVIYAEPSTWTGSIGVIIPHFDVSGLMKEWNVEDDSIVSHPLKDLGTPFKEMTEKEREILQGLVNTSFEGFKDKVRYGRPTFRDNDAALDQVATGQVFAAKQALELGLVDKIDYVEAAVARSIDLAGLDAEDVRVIEYKAPPDLFSALTGGQIQSPSGGLRVESLFELASPRAYYLSTWFPAILSTAR